MSSTKQKAWLEHYFKCWNATEAARRAGYKWPNPRGPELKKKLQAEINARLAEMAMPANEVLARLGKHAGITFDDFVDVIELDDKGRSTVIVSLSKAKERGMLDCIKKLTYHKDGGYTLELHDAQSALMHLDKIHGGLGGKSIRQRHDVTTKGESLNVGRLTDEERIDRLVALLDTARARRDRRDTGDAGAATVDAIAGTTD